MNKHIKYLLLLFTLVISSCSDDDDNNLLPVQERKDNAIADLVEKLSAPANGWRINYQPTPESGIFFMLLKFDENGNVNIKSDVVESDGEYTNQDITYRIDSNLGLELIFETYAVFHFLFEKDQASFGAEFEFIYLEEDGGNLIFESKTDFSDKTILVFEPANASDEDLFSRELAENFDKFSGNTPLVFGGASPIQQIVLNDKNMSVFWSIDISKRFVTVDMAGKGTTIAEINSNTDNVIINHITGYSFASGKLILTQPFSFTLNGENITISELTLNNLVDTGDPLCIGSGENTPIYEGEISGLGSISLKRSLFSSEGLAFQPMTETPYSVNVLFVFDETARSLFEGDRIIENRFPSATGFVFYYGFESDSLPANSVGFIVEDNEGNPQTLLREFEPTVTEGNKISITLKDEFFYSAPNTGSEEQDLTEITDLIFDGGNIYAYDLPVSGLKVFRLFNPCNGYEFFLVQ